MPSQAHYYINCILIIILVSMLLTLVSADDEVPDLDAEMMFQNSTDNEEPDSSNATTEANLMVMNAPTTSEQAKSNLNNKAEGTIAPKFTSPLSDQQPLPQGTSDNAPTIERSNKDEESALLDKSPTIGLSDILNQQPKGSTVWIPSQVHEENGNKKSPTKVSEYGSLNIASTETKEPQLKKAETDPNLSSAASGRGALPNIGTSQVDSEALDQHPKEKLNKNSNVPIKTTSEIISTDEDSLAKKMMNGKKKEDSEVNPEGTQSDPTQIGSIAPGEKKTNIDTDTLDQLPKGKTSVLNSTKGNVISDSAKKLDDTKATLDDTLDTLEKPKKDKVENPSAQGSETTVSQDASVPLDFKKKKDNDNNNSLASKDNVMDAVLKDLEKHVKSGGSEIDDHAALSEKDFEKLKQQKNKTATSRDQPSPTDLKDIASVDMEAAPKKNLDNATTTEGDLIAKTTMGNATARQISLENGTATSISRKLNKDDSKLIINATTDYTDTNATSDGEKISENKQSLNGTLATRADIVSDATTTVTAENEILPPPPPLKANQDKAKQSTTVDAQTTLAEKEDTNAPEVVISETRAVETELQKKAKGDPVENVEEDIVATTKAAKSTTVKPKEEEEDILQRPPPTVAIPHKTKDERVVGGKPSKKTKRHNDEDETQDDVAATTKENKRFIPTTKANKRVNTEENAKSEQQEDDQQHKIRKDEYPSSSSDAGSDWSDPQFIFQTILYSLVGLAGLLVAAKLVSIFNLTKERFYDGLCLGLESKYQRMSAESPTPKLYYVIKCYRVLVTIGAFVGIGVIALLNLIEKTVGKYCGSKNGHQHAFSAIPTSEDGKPQGSTESTANVSTSGGAGGYRTTSYYTNNATEMSSLPSGGVRGGGAGMQLGGVRKPSALGGGGIGGGGLNKRTASVDSHGGNANGSNNSRNQSPSAFGSPPFSGQSNKVTGAGLSSPNYTTPASATKVSQKPITADSNKAGGGWSDDDGFGSDGDDTPLVAASSVAPPPPATTTNLIAQRSVPAATTAPVTGWSDDDGLAFSDDDDNVATTTTREAKQGATSASASVGSLPPVPAATINAPTATAVRKPPAREEGATAVRKPLLKKKSLD